MKLWSCEGVVAFWVIVLPIATALVGLVLALYLIMTRHGALATGAFCLLAAGGLAMVSFRGLWGWHTILGFTFVFNEYDLLYLIGTLLVGGWILNVLAILRWRREPQK